MTTNDTMFTPLSRKVTKPSLARAKANARFEHIARNRTDVYPLRSKNPNRELWHVLGVTFELTDETISFLHPVETGDDDGVLVVNLGYGKISYECSNDVFMQNLIRQSKIKE